MPNHFAISLENLSLTLTSRAGEVHILRDIQLAVKQGESVSLMGPSGSGKTSLLMLAAGLERPTRGRVIISGTDITPMSEDALALFRRHHIGIVFQAFHLIPTMTALENVSIPLELARRDNAEDLAREALARVGLAERFHHLPSELSGGEQQRVAIARAFAMRPPILLADEPTGNLDQENGQRIMQLLFDLHREERTTLILVTHDRALAGRCHRIVALKDGAIEPHHASAAARA